MRVLPLLLQSDTDTGRIFDKVCETGESDSNRIFNKRVLRQQKLEEHMKISIHL